MSRKVVIVLAAVILLCIIVLLILLTCMPKTCHDTDIAKYQYWQDSVTKTVEKEFAPALPARETVEAYGKEYNYSFSQGALGAPNFVIYVSLQFPDKESYEKELEKYSTLLTNPIQQNNDCHYAVQYSLEKVAAYTDEEIRDGMFYNFELISTNENEYVISFLVARVWDYYKNDFLADYLVSVRDSA